MTVRLIEPEAARFDNTRIYIHKRCEKEGGAVDGRYIRIGRMFQLGVPDLKRRQFLGIHKNLFVTIGYPDYVQDLMGVATDLPRVPGIGAITWVTSLACSTSKKAMWYFIPRNIWEHTPADFDGTLYTTSVISIVTGEGGGQYHLLSIPLITREFLRSKYKKVRDKRGRKKG